MRKRQFLTAILFVLAVPAAAQLSVGVGLPGVSIGINLPMYPKMARVPGYPVYYAPGINANFFFYDGLYWVLHGDDWYASSWYNGPWGLVGRGSVPLYVLRVPVRYYRQPPSYFHGWSRDAPPRWGQQWGGDWERSRSGWDVWDRKSVPAPAPLPSYQRQFSGERYPQQAERQQALHQQNYRYQPRDEVVQQHYRQRQSEPPPRHAPEPEREKPLKGGQGGRHVPESDTPREFDRGKGQPPGDHGRGEGRGSDRNR